MNEKIGSNFIEKTKYQYLKPSPQEMKDPQPPLELEYAQDLKLIQLPKPENINLPSMDLRQAIEQRISIRQYSLENLSMEELSMMLWLTQGIKEVTNRPATLRTVPSAGARHAFETFLLINRIDGLAPGVYRFLAIEHALLEINLDSQISIQLEQACRGQKMITRSAVTFFWAAVTERMTWRYTERGYRYLHLDAGHVCQNLYLAGEAMGCGTCAIGAYDDDEVNELLGLDGDKMFVIYIAATGKKLPGSA